MHSVIHQWEDGYGASITFTLMKGFRAATGAAESFAYVVAEADAKHCDPQRLTTAPADVMADAEDLRALASAALAMADALDAEE